MDAVPREGDRVDGSVGVVLPDLDDAPVPDTDSDLLSSSSSSILLSSFLDISKEKQGNFHLYESIPEGIDKEIHFYEKRDEKRIKSEYF